ncbi:MAG: beta-lactamase [Chitinophagaceae bacterium]|nr:MAG: beta-lactamase [Chitinophagaceae bacterium]
MVYEPALGFSKKEIDPLSWNGWRNYSLIGEVNDGNAWYANGGISGAAGLFSTIDDIQRLVDFLMQKDFNKSNPLISTKTIQQFLTMDQFNNGLGWMMDTTNSFLKGAPVGSFGHTGFTGTSIAVIPKYNISVVLLINRQQRGLLPTGEYYNLGPLRAQVIKAILKYCK